MKKIEQEKLIKQMEWDLDWVLGYLKKSRPANAIYETEQRELIQRLEKYKQDWDNDED